MCLVLLFGMRKFGLAQNATAPRFVSLEGDEDDGFRMCEEVVVS